MEKQAQIKKDFSIETLRGITIILMVAGHVVGGDTTGLKTEGDSVLRYIFHAFAFIRMPMFTAISGYIYASHSLETFKEVAPFIKKKSTRLLIPFCTVVTIFYLFKKIVPDVNTPAPAFNSVWKVYLLSYEHFWFVQAIFLVFVIIAVLEASKLISSFNNWLLILGFVFLVSIFVTIPSTIFSINRVPYLLSFFLLGLGLKRFKSEIELYKANKVLFYLFVASFLLQQVLYFKGITLTGTNLQILSNCVGLSGITTIILLRPSNRFLASIGFFSFGIYLLHVFATAGMRIVLKYTGMENSLLLFSLSLLAGILFPILLQKVVAKRPILNLLLFGQSLKSKDIDQGKLLNSGKPNEFQPAICQEGSSKVYS